MYITMGRCHCGKSAPVELEHCLLLLIFCSTLITELNYNANAQGACYVRTIVSNNSDIYNAIDYTINYETDYAINYALNSSVSQCGESNHFTIYYPFTLRKVRDKCPGFSPHFELDCDEATGNLYLNNQALDNQSSILQILELYYNRLIVNVSSYTLQSSSNKESFWLSTSPITLSPPFLVSRQLSRYRQDELPVNRLGLFNCRDAIATVIAADRRLGGRDPIGNTVNFTSCVSDVTSEQCIDIQSSSCRCSSSLPRSNDSNHYIRYLSYGLSSISPSTQNISSGAQVSVFSNEGTDYFSMSISWEVDPSSGCKNILNNDSIPADECECPDGQFFSGSTCLTSPLTSRISPWSAFTLSVPKLGRGLYYGAIGAEAIIYLIVCSLARIIFIVRERKRRQCFIQNGGVELQTYITSRGRHASRFFTKMELREATDNYSQNMKLGEGGFGTVYKGCLKDGCLVAIKKANLRHSNDNEQFLNELSILMSIHHKHIVKILGCCLETESPLLVYEYVSNGNLSEWLHGQDEIDNCKMDWEQRLKVATQIAEALAYLHGSASPPILHRDIKSTNILLDESMDAKVADFGLARLVPNVGTHVSTLVKGTIGYLDPEYFQTLKLTDKSDVYSFGVILLEMVTSLKPLNGNLQRVEGNPYSRLSYSSLSLLFISYMQEGKVEDLFDPRLENPSTSSPQHAKEPRCIHSSMMEVAKLAYCCLAQKSIHRPKMIVAADQLKHIASCLQNNVEYNNVVRFSIPCRMTLNVLNTAEVSLFSTNDSIDQDGETSLTMPR